MTLKRLTFTFSGLLLVGLLLEWWLFYYSGLNLAGHILNTPIDTRGLLLILLLLTVFIVYIKKLIKLDSSLSILRLTLSGTVVCFVAESIFQTIKLLVENNDTLHEGLLYLTTGIIGITIFGAVLSFFVSYQLKTRRTAMLVLFIFSFMALIVFLRTLLPPTID